MGLCRGGDGQDNAEILSKILTRDKGHGSVRVFHGKKVELSKVLKRELPAQSDI